MQKRTSYFTSRPLVKKNGVCAQINALQLDGDEDVYWLVILPLSFYLSKKDSCQDTMWNYVYTHLSVSIYQRVSTLFLSWNHQSTQALHGSLGLLIGKTFSPLISWWSNEHLEAPGVFVFSLIWVLHLSWELSTTGARVFWSTPDLTEPHHPGSKSVLGNYCWMNAKSWEDSLSQSPLSGKNAEPAILWSKTRPSQFGKWYRIKPKDCLQQNLLKPLMWPCKSFPAGW
jgi:hypothetical protein